MHRFQPGAALLTTVALLSALHLITRLYGLLVLPPFLDERFVISHAHELVSTSLGLWGEVATGGRVLTSLSIVAVSAIAGVLQPLISTSGTSVDWLLAGRLATVLASLGAMLGVFALGRTLWSVRAGVLAALLYIFVPFAYFHDRMIMAEAFLSACGLLTATLSIHVVRKRMTNPLPLALSLILVALAEPLPALFFAAFPIWTWLWFRAPAHSQGSLAVVLKSYVLLLMSGAVAAILVGPGKLLSSAHIMLTNLVGDQFGGTVPSLADVPRHIAAYSGPFLEWFWDYLGPWFLLLLCLAAFLAITRRDKAICFSLLSGAAFITSFLVVPGGLSPRYLVPGIALLAPAMGRAGDVGFGYLVATYSAIRSARFPGYSAAVVPVLAAPLYLGAMIWGAAFEWQSVHQPISLALPAVDRSQYIENWPSGYGYPEAIAWIRADSSDTGRAFIVGRYLNSNFEPLAWMDGLETIIVPELRYFAYPRELDEDTRSSFSEKLRDPKVKVYYLEAREAKQGPPKEHMIETMRVVPVASFPKPGGLTSVDVYRVFPTPEWVASRTVVDFIRELNEGKLRVSAPPGAKAEQYVHVRTFAIDGDVRDVLFMHPTSSASNTVALPKRASLEFSLALDPETWDKGSEGVDFAVEVQDGAHIETIFSAYVDPSHDPAQRHWIDETVGLEKFGGRQITLTLSTRPHGKPDYDWAGWGQPRIVLP